MSLRKRAIFISIISVILSVGILYLASQLFLVKSYEQIEEQETIDDLQRVANALQDHIQSLEKIAIGYAQWDDTRDFIQNSKPDYVENNFTEGVYEDTGLDIAIFVDTQGKIVFKKAVNRQTTSEVGVPISLINQLKPDSVLLNQSDVDSSVAGILPLPEGNLIVISLPVSNNQGISPIYGYMVWGRFIDEEMIQQIDESTRLKATIVAYDLPSFGADFESAKDELTSARPFFIQAVDAETVQGYTVINDIFDQPALLVRVSLPRIVYQQGKSNLSYFLIALVLLTCLTSAITLLLLNHVILTRLRTLSASVSTIQTTNDLRVPITIDGTDELARLADGIRGMLISLEQSRAELQESNFLLEQRVSERTAESERAKTRIEAIFHHSGDGIILVDVEDGIQQSNQAFNQLFKAEPDAFFGMPLECLINVEDRDTFNNLLARVAQAQMAQHIELRALRSDGSSFDAEISISAIRSSLEPITNLVCIIRDISERKQAQQAVAEERNLLRTLIDAVPDYIYVKDSQHRIILNNTAHVLTLGGIASSEVIGKTDFDLFPAEMAAKFHEDERVVLAGTPVFNTEERSKGIGGQDIWALTTKVPLRNLKGNVIGLVGITHDVTAIKASEEALRRSEETLQKALEKEKELSELKSRFVSMASHEFRTPLTIINNSAYILKKHRHTLDDANHDARLTNIVSQVGYLSDIIDEVLDLTRSESQDFKLNLVKTDWVVFCKGIVDEFKLLEHNQHIIEFLSPDDPIWVECNSLAMRKAISNLISNAQKYSPDRGKIEIVIENLQNTAKLSIRDEGIGIPQEDQARLFEPFHRAKNVGTIRGTGLGLVITKQAVEQHGGSISFVSQPEVGTTFTITLPIIKTHNSIEKLPLAHATHLAP